MEKVLHLTLKKEWFDLILSGDKKIEYREIKNHWVKMFPGLTMVQGHFHIRETNIFI